MMMKFANILGFAILISLTFVCCVAVAGVTYAAAQSVDKAPVVCPGTNGLTQAEITKILDAHNHPRARRKLEPLTWDCKLADFAQEWATRGVLEHREYNMYGENIFVAGSRKVHAASAIDHWMHEKSSWNNDTGACKSGKVCAHYTQIVWKTTARVGCGINRQAPGGKWKTMLVCNYDPAGNHPGPAY